MSPACCIRPWSSSPTRPLLRPLLEHRLIGEIRWPQTHLSGRGTGSRTFFSCSCGPQISSRPLSSPPLFAGPSCASVRPRRARCPRDVVSEGWLRFGQPGRSISTRRDVVVDPVVLLHVRLFYPCSTAAAGAEPVPVSVVVFFHGGGFASPEHRFPAAYDDGFAVLRFLDDPSNHAAAVLIPLPLDVSRCLLTDDSAGGNITHHVVRRYAAARPTFSTVRLAGLLAIQPLFGGEERTPTELRLHSAPIVNMARADWTCCAFLPRSADRTHEAAASPTVAAGIDSPHFPPTTVVGGYDRLQDWQHHYSDALLAQGKDVRVLEYPDAIHTFYLFPEFADAKDLMLRIKEIVAGSSGAP